MWESGVHILYGTAWKKDQMARLVEEAVTAGFRYIDTACQPKHYNEADVGEGWTNGKKFWFRQIRDLPTEKIHSY